ncbi:MAG TPA: inositol monophosphatase family protein [Actinocrinis sp.]|nr:inositol monophosphatase family protein [Actinocrinis sp.]
MEEPSKLADLAREIAEEAGRLLVHGRPGDLGVLSTKSSPTDVVTEMDTAAERLIRDRIALARPGDAVLGEEGGGQAGSSGVTWVVDPIDGTVNYLYDLPAWAVSIGVEVDGVTVAGAVAAPRLGEVYTGWLGGGAWCNGRQIAVRSDTGLAGALVATGFGYQAARRDRQGAVVAGLLPRVRDIRRAGSAALDLCSVACGRVDAYFERGTQVWDRSAGGLIAAEAGATVAGFRGAQASEAMTLAASAATFGLLHDVLVELGADRDDY